jgi:hypothetical protein
MWGMLEVLRSGYILVPWVSNPKDCAQPTETIPPPQTAPRSGAIFNEPVAPLRGAYMGGALQTGVAHNLSDCLFMAAKMYILWMWALSRHCTSPLTLLQKEKGRVVRLCMRVLYAISKAVCLQKILPL